MKKIVIIPARLQSERLKNKMLLQVNGSPIIQHTLERARQSSADKVYVATDSKLIADAIGDDAILTGDWPTGTDRVSAACEELGIDNDTLVVNVQGDEPEIDPAHIDLVFQLLEQHSIAAVATIVTPIDGLAIGKESVVKAIVKHAVDITVCQSFARTSKDVSNWALAGYGVRRHVGIYGYRRPFLEVFRKTPQPPIELKEKLEQYRMLLVCAKGHMICGEVESAAVGIDTHEDYREFVKRMRKG